jgi:hypothetical protein
MKLQGYGDGLETLYGASSEAKPTWYAIGFTNKQDQACSKLTHLRMFQIRFPGRTTKISRSSPKK